MTKSIIRAIFKCEKGNHEIMPCSPKQNEHVQKYWEYEELLEKILTDEQKKVLELYNKEQFEIEFETEAIAYCEGFKIGLLIGMECMEYKLSLDAKEQTESL